MAPAVYAVELTDGAERDLDEIHAHRILHRSLEDADALLDDFIERIATLERFPLRGAYPPELASLGLHEFRQILMLPYRLIYRVIGSRVVIMLIADGRRDMQALLERRLLRHGTG